MPAHWHEDIELFVPNEGEVIYNINGKIVKELGLSFGGIDLLFGKDNEPIFCEANSNAYFNEINKVTNVKVEDYIFDYILKNIC